jgi:hypothetical protein
MSAQSRTPVVDDIPFGFTEADGVHAKSWEEKFQADEATLEGRAWASDFLAAFRTAQAYFAREYREPLRTAYGDEWAKVLDQSFKVYAALIDAAADGDEAKSKVRRFECPAWKAQTHLSRTFLPPLDDEEFKRMSDTLARGWQRLGWTWVRRLQLVTGVALFECDTVGFKANRDKKPATYTDRFTDLLLATMRGARASRRKNRVNKFDLAFAACLKEFQKDGRIPVYAPDARDKTEQEAREKVKAEKAELEAKLKAEAAAARKEPTIQIEAITRRAAAKAGKIAAELPEDEAHAVAVAFMEWANEEWERATGKVLPFPPVPPVIKTADTEISAESEKCELIASPQDQDCDFTAENNDPALFSADNLSAGALVLEVLEFDPEPEPRGVNLEHAQLAAQACASVGIGQHIKTIFVDDTKSFEGGCTFAEETNIVQFQERLPAYLKRNHDSGVESMTVRIRWKGETQYLQIDDCTSEVMERLAPFAFLQFWTSPECGQTFLAFADKLALEQYKELRHRIFDGPIKKSGANGGAHGSIRWPGSQNKKPKRRYPDGESPRVQLARVAMGRKVAVAELEAAGLLAAPKPKPTVEEVRVIRGRFPKAGDFPDMNHYLATSKDRSTAEMKWCVRALGMGHTRAAVEAELMRIGEKARARNNDSYARDTVNNAAEHIGLNQRRESYAGGAA